MIAALNVAPTRGSDVLTEDGYLATCEVDCLIDLDLCLGDLLGVGDLEENHRYDIKKIIKLVCDQDRLAADNESLSKELDNIKLQLKLQQDLFDSSEQDARDSETVNDEYIALLYKQSKKLLHSLTELVSTSESNERQLSESLADFPFIESASLKKSKLLIKELSD